VYGWADSFEGKRFPRRKELDSVGTKKRRKIIGNGLRHRAGGNGNDNRASLCVGDKSSKNRGTCDFGNSNDCIALSGDGIDARL
jgi:hypothetical protein